MTRLWILLLATTAVSGCSAPPFKGQAQTDAHVQVRAGDLFTVQGRPVRLSNAQAPSLPPEARCWGEAALAVQAAAKAEALLASAKTVSVEPDGVDADGKPMVRVTLNGQRDLGEALVFAGVAARRSDQAWDWCGTPDFIADGGPQFASGPQRNARFMDWMAKAEAQRMSHQVANSFLGAEAVQAEFYAF